MRNIGDKFPAHLLETLDARDVVQDDDRTRMVGTQLQRRNAQFKNPGCALPLDGDFAAMLFAPLQSQLDEAVHGGMAEGFDHGPSDRRAGKLKHGLDTAIGLQETEAPVDGKDALGDAGQDSIELGALAVRGAIEVASLPRDRLDVALRRAQTGREIEGERTSQLAVGHPAQGGAQAQNAREIADDKEQQNGRREQPGYHRPVQGFVLPALKQ